MNSTTDGEGSLHLKLEDFASDIRARLINAGDRPIPVIQRVSTDTRTLQSGSCFVALVGPSFDAHAFLDEAVLKGADLLIISTVPERPPDLPCLVVEDTLHALGEMARVWRTRNMHVHTLSIVGSSGKTTTKEMAAAVLSPDAETLVTRGNLNNLIGLPHMVFEMGRKHERAVLELGMNTPGELKRLMEIAQPDALLLTNITNAHIGMFGSQEELYQAKTDSLRAARKDAVLIMNADDELSIRARREYASGRRVIDFGLAANAAIRAENTQALEPYGYAFDLMIGAQGFPVRLKAFGRHNIPNALAAAAAGEYFGVAPDRIAQRLSSFRPKANRSEVEEIQGWHLVKDYYNAAPSAVESALRSLADFKVPGRRIAVLADMMELGDLEEPFHRSVGKTAALHAGLSKLITLGERGRWISNEASRHGLQCDHLPDIEAVAARIRHEIRPGDLLLIKGSRVMKLEELYTLLKG